MIKPLGSRVVIQADTQEKQTKSGIIIAATTKEKAMMTGEVVEVGPDVSSIIEGDRVIFAEQYFETYKQGEDKFQIGKEEDVLAIITKD